MATVTILNGWDVKPERAARATEDGVENVWNLILIERSTGNRIVFEHNDDVKDHLVRKYTGGVVLGG